MHNSWTPKHSIHRRRIIPSDSRIYFRCLNCEDLIASDYTESHSQICNKVDKTLYELNPPEEIDVKLTRYEYSLRK